MGWTIKQINDGRDFEVVHNDKNGIREDILDDSGYLDNVLEKVSKKSSLEKREEYNTR